MNSRELLYREELRHDGYSKEDEYFFRRDQELLARLRAEADQARQQAQSTYERETHWMRCPKCGGRLEEETYHGLVQIDRCLSCDGIFLDRGELEIIAKAKPGLLERITGKR